MILRIGYTSEYGCNAGIRRDLADYSKATIYVYFEFLQDSINVDFSESKYYQSEADAYKTGEEINAYLIKLFNLKEDAFVKIFTLWASICGVIQMTDQRTEYIKSNQA